MPTKLTDNPDAAAERSGEVSILVGGHRDGWAYFTSELDAPTTLSDGYRRTGSFKPHAWSGMKTEPVQARIWRAK